MRVEESIEIGRPLKEVFDYVSEPDNFPEWTGTAIDVSKGTPGPVRERDTFTVAIKFLGRRFETPYERTSYEPDRLFKERAAGGPIPDQEWTYTGFAHKLRFWGQFMCNSDFCTKIVAR